MTASIRRAVATLALAIPCTLAAQGKPAGKAPTARDLPLKDLNPIEVTSIAPRVGSIKVVPSTLTIHVGETVSFGKLTVTAYDSSGRAFGNLPGYDFGIKPGEPATAVPKQVTGVRPGTTELVINYPGSSWKARKDPRVQAKVKIVVVK